MGRKLADLNIPMSEGEKDILREARDKKIGLVFAAGNDSLNMSRYPYLQQRFQFIFGFFGEMTHGFCSLGLTKPTKHSFTPISLILFLISSISLLRGF